MSADRLLHFLIAADTDAAVAVFITELIRQILLHPGNAGIATYRGSEVEVEHKPDWMCTRSWNASAGKRCATG